MGKNSISIFHRKKGKKAKTPLGWKAFFTMRRTPAHKDKSRSTKSETPELQVPLATTSLLETPTRRKKLRTVKSAESLLPMGISSQSNSVRSSDVSEVEHLMGAQGISTNSPLLLHGKNVK